METSTAASSKAAAREFSKRAGLDLQADELDRIIREQECERLSGLSRTTRWRLERKGRFPRRLILSDNAVGWRLSEVLAWRAALPARAEVAA
jgi:prophage regulatory protein